MFSDMFNDEKECIEFWEHEYLKNIHNTLVLDKERMKDGFASKEEIRDDWEQFLGDNISDFAVGSERIFYWLFNQFGQPNSSPIGSDLFFETYNAFVHIDIKTVTAKNVNDINGTIFVGDNQNSYSGVIEKRDGNNEQYSGNLPHYYTKANGQKKICLTYFICILYTTEGDIQFISLLSMPNGKLYDTYGNRVLSAGKNHGKIRFNFNQTSSFRNLPNTPSRIKFIHVNPNMDEDLKRQSDKILQYYESSDAIEEDID